MPSSLQKLFFFSAFVFLFLLPVFPVSSQSPNPLPEQSFLSKVISFEWIQSFFSHFFQQKTTLSSLLIGGDTQQPQSIAETVDTADTNTPSSSTPSSWIFVCPRYHAFFSKEAISSNFTACTSPKEYQGSTCACEDTSFTSTDVTSQASWSVTLPEGSSSFASVSTDGTVTGDAKKLPRGIGIGYAKVSASLNEKKDTSEVSVQMPNGGFSTIAVEGDEGGGGGNGGGGSCSGVSGWTDPFPGQTGIVSRGPSYVLFTVSRISNRTYVPGCIDNHAQDDSCRFNSLMDGSTTYVTAMKSGCGNGESFRIKSDDPELNMWEHCESLRFWASLTPNGSAISPECDGTDKGFHLSVVDKQSYDNRTMINTAGNILDLFFGFCVVPSGTTIYFNVKGNAGCATQII